MVFFIKFSLMPSLDFNLLDSAFFSRSHLAQRTFNHGTERKHMACWCRKQDTLQTTQLQALVRCHFRKNLKIPSLISQPMFFWPLLCKHNKANWIDFNVNHAISSTMQSFGNLSLLTSGNPLIIYLSHFTFTGSFVNQKPVFSKDILFGIVLCIPHC